MKKGLNINTNVVQLRGQNINEVPCNQGYVNVSWDTESSNYKSKIANWNSAKLKTYVKSKHLQEGEKTDSGWKIFLVNTYAHTSMLWHVSKLYLQLLKSIIKRQETQFFQQVKTQKVVSKTRVLECKWQTLSQKMLTATIGKHN